MTPLVSIQNPVPEILWEGEVRGITSFSDFFGKCFVMAWNYFHKPDRVKWIHATFHVVGKCFSIFLQMFLTHLTMQCFFPT